jgi:SOS response regulatory protein OraA/RecX
MIKLKSLLIEVMKKKSVNENLALGILATLSGILIGKIALYYIGQLVEKGIKYFNGSKETEKEISGILDKLESNKKFISDVTEYIEKNNGVNDAAADKMVKSSYVQSLIKKVNNDNVDKADLESGLKNIFLKAWSNDKDTAIEKVKKDIK